MSNDPTQELAGKVAIVTGSSSGIGEETARRLSALGASVVVNSSSSVEAGTAIANSLPGESLYVQADISDQEQGKALIDATIERFGKLDILVNNAGMQFRSPLEEFPHDKWTELLATNLNSVFNVSKPVAGYMIKRKSGKMVNICSVQSELGRPGIAPYAASKGALKMLTKGMCTDWGQYGIQVNGLGPGYFKTELTDALVKDAEFTAWLENRSPGRRWGDVEELVGAAIFLSSNASSFVNGHILYVDGGITSSL